MPSQQLYESKTAAAAAETRVRLPANTNPSLFNFLRFSTAASISPYPISAFILITHILPALHKVATQGFGFFFPSAGEKKVCMTGGEGTRRLHQCLSTLQKYSCQKSRADVPNPSIKFHTTRLQLQRSVCQLMCRSQTRKAAAECGVNDRSQCKSCEAHPFVSPS